MKKSLLFTFSLFALFLFARPVEAAQLTVLGDKVTASPGDIIRASIYVNSEGQNINNAEGTLSFPTDLLSAESVSTADSIFNLWIEQPSFSNTFGTVSFNGGVPNPGFSGAFGKIVQVNFRAKAAGSATLSFSTGVVRVNDGLGTAATMSAMKSFSLQIGAVVVEQEPEPTFGLSTPIITSSTHPDPSKWYPLSDATFSWAVPKDTDFVKVLFNKDPSSSPTVVYSPAIKEKTVDKLADGVWYFHAQFGNEQGVSKVAHFRLQIDTQKPESFEASEITRDDETEPKAQFSLQAKDKTSGIDHFEIVLDKGKPQTLSPAQGKIIYQTEALAPKKYTLLARAYDKAGNFEERTLSFMIASIASPTITEYPKQLKVDGQVIVKGTAPEAGEKVLLTFEGTNGKRDVETVTSDTSGNFILSIPAEKLGNDIFRLWAEAVDSRGVKSLPTPQVVINIGVARLTWLFEASVSVSVVVIIGVALMLLLLLLMALIEWVKINHYKEREKEMKKAESALEKRIKAIENKLKRD